VDAERPVARAIAIVGPTASGKSRAAMHVAAALPVEIISMDSAQVYRGMDVGTAKPTLAERAAVPHHLIDIIEATDAYSAARFRDDASAVIHEVAARGRTPLLVGGTMLYLKALREGLSAMPATDPAVRERIAGEARTSGWPAMHARLAAIDPRTAERLAPNDAQRVGRALEVHAMSGRTLSSWLVETPPHRDRFEVPVVALMPNDRGALHRVIDDRFDAMVDAGLVDELRQLRARLPLTAAHASMRCVGYRQAWQFLDGAIDGRGLRASGQAATRQLAKRQMTWIRPMPDIVVIDSDAPDMCERVLEAVRQAIDA